ncbi:MAG: c-type cytochrome [Gemmatimonadaceae bacterium]|nr:c-type cytochrome [Chitinophagaceae bacterium]
MIQYRPLAKTFFYGIFLLTLISVGNKVAAQDGKALFTENCASCHHPIKDGTGPALQGVTARVGDPKKLHAWVKNSQAVLATGDAYFNKLYVERNKAAMTPFPSLTDAEIDAIIGYAEAFKAPVSTPDNPDEAAKNQANDNSLLYGILTLILAIITLILLQVNSNLKKLADDKEGHFTGEPVPFYRNKAYIAMIAVVLFVIGGYYTIQGAVGLGRHKDYQPEQPIYYSHKVHAGTNQVSCLYCHSGAYEGKHANIPSMNVCMNCHMAINEYAGPEIRHEDGSVVDGTAEIQKIYDATGWDPKAKKYTKPAKPVEWVKIHNLPDHVYFNHSQHANAGNVQCQTCHGPIQEMDEVKQFTDLSMSWCINCHRESKVNFYDEKTGEGNKFYSIYQKFHNDIKNKKVDSVTVEMIGGTECQKCHY